VAPHSDGREFPLGIEKYRGIVEGELFDRLGRPLFFYEAVGMLLKRIAVRVEQQDPGTATSCAASAPRWGWIRRLEEREARKLECEIESRFVTEGLLELRSECGESVGNGTG
jgi:hypothetical protein